MWHIYFIMWASGSWKWTLIRNLKSLKDENFYFPLSYKTRTIRENEINWVDAFFVSKEEFFSGVQNWEFLEYAVLYDWADYYWTKFEDVIDKWIKSWKKVVKELDINWLEDLRKNRADLDEVYTTIFLNIPPELLKQRIEKRWAFMSNEELERRINTCSQENIRAKEICDFIIDGTMNEDEIVKEFLNIIKKS